MLRFTLDPDALRSAADRAARVAADATPPVFRQPARTGHADVTAAVADFARALSNGWADRAARIDGIGATARRSVSLYAQADSDGRGQVRAVASAAGLAF